MPLDLTLYCCDSLICEGEQSDRINDRVRGGGGLPPLPEAPLYSAMTEY